MKVKLNVPLEVWDEEQGKFVWRDPGYIHEHPDAYKLVGAIEQKLGKYHKVRVASPVDDEAKLASFRYIAAAEETARKKLQAAEAELQQYREMEEEDDDD